MNFSGSKEKTTELCVVAMALSKPGENEAHVYQDQSLHGIYDFKLNLNNKLTSQLDGCYVDCSDNRRWDNVSFLDGILAVERV